MNERKYMQFSSFFETLESRKAKFWQQCCACAARHPEWPKDGVEDFFLHWTAVNRQGQMRWELQNFWSTGHRMGSYMKHRRYLDQYWNARLERARGKAQAKSLEQTRAEAQDAEAQNAYDQYFEEQENEESRKLENERIRK